MKYRTETESKCRALIYHLFSQEIAIPTGDLVVKFLLEPGNGNVDGHTNRWNYTNFKSNLAMVVIYLPVKFEFYWTKRFRIGVRKRKC